MRVFSSATNVLVASLLAATYVSSGDVEAGISSVAYSHTGGPKYIDTDSNNAVWGTLSTTNRVFRLTYTNAASTPGYNVFSTAATGHNGLAVSKSTNQVVVGQAGAVVVVNNPPTAIQKTFNVGGNPTVFLNDKNKQIWAPLFSNKVAIMDLAGLSFITTVSVGKANTLEAAFDSGNNGWISCSTEQGAIFKITQGTWEVSGPFGESALQTPMGITTDSSDNIWVVSSGNNLLVKFDASGNVLSQIATGNSPSSVRIHPPTKNLIVTHSGDTALYILNSSGKLLEAADVGLKTNNLAFDNTGAIWITGTDAGKVIRATYSASTLFPTTAAPTSAPVTGTPTTLTPTSSPTPPTTSAPSSSPTVSNCDILELRECKKNPVCVWIPIKNGISACRARELVLVDCSQYINYPACKAPGHPFTYCVWNSDTFKCLNRFTPNPTTFTDVPTTSPTSKPTRQPTTRKPSRRPTNTPTRKPTHAPTESPTTPKPTLLPTTKNPTTLSPTDANSLSPTTSPTSQCDAIPDQTNCEANSACKWTQIKNAVNACRGVNWGTTSHVDCASFTTLTDCQTLTNGVSFCYWDKPNKTCRNRLA